MMKRLFMIISFLALCCSFALSDQSSDTFRRDINNMKSGFTKYSSATQIKLNTKLNKSIFQAYTSIGRVPYSGASEDVNLGAHSITAAAFHGPLFGNASSATIANNVRWSEEVKDPTGFIDPDNIATSYDSTARTIMLTHSSGSIDYNWRGIKHTLSSPWTSSAHTNVNDRYFLSSADGTNFTWSTTAWTFDQLQVAIANYGASDKFGLSENHGMMPWTVHQEAHDLLGTYRVSGGAPTAGTYTENTASDAATTPSFDAAVIKDEDRTHTLPAWSQGTYTTLRIGASSVATFDTAASFPFRSSGSYILVNNPTTGGEAAGTNNRYVNVYQVMIPVTDDATSQLYRMVMLQPQAEYATLVGAKAEDPRGLSLGSLATTAPEIVFFSRITYALSAGDGNTGKCRIATGGITYITGTRQSQVSTGGFTPGPSAGASYIVQTADASLPNAQAMGALATGIVKNTTTTGVQSIAVAADFPTLNQNTTGTAAGLSGSPSITISGATSSGLITSQNLTTTSGDNDYYKLLNAASSDGSRSNLVWAQTSGGLTMGRYGMEWNLGRSQMDFVWRNQYNGGASSSENMRLTGGGDLSITGTIGAAGGSTNKAVCWKSTGILGYCSTVVAADGSCTCN